MKILKHKSINHYGAALPFCYDSMKGGLPTYFLTFFASSVSIKIKYNFPQMKSPLHRSQRAIHNSSQLYSIIIKYEAYWELLQGPFT